MCKFVYSYKLKSLPLVLGVALSKRIVWWFFQGGIVEVGIFKLAVRSVKRFLMTPLQ